MGNFKKQYRDLETRVMNELRAKIESSETKSKFTNTKSIVANVFDYIELTIINDHLIFIDGRGLQYSVFSNTTLEDLIDILNN